MNDETDNQVIVTETELSEPLPDRETLPNAIVAGATLTPKEGIEIRTTLAAPNGR